MQALQEFTSYAIDAVVRKKSFVGELDRVSIYNIFSALEIVNPVLKYAAMFALPSMFYFRILQGKVFNDR